MPNAIRLGVGCIPIQNGFQPGHQMLHPPAPVFRFSALVRFPRQQSICKVECGQQRDVEHGFPLNPRADLRERLVQEAFDLPYVGFTVMAGDIESLSRDSDVIPGGFLLCQIS